MGCECTGTEDRKLPTMVICTLANGFGTNKSWDRVVGFGGEIVGNYNNKVEVEFFVKTNGDAEIFNLWVKEELQNGTLPFEIDLPITGIVKTHTVRFAPSISQNSFIGGTIKIKATLEVVELNDTFECQIC